MPMGSHHGETSWLNEERRQLSLRRGVDGNQRIDAPHAAKKLIGHRDRVIGTRFA